MSKHTPGPWHIGGRTILRPTLTIFHKPFGLGDVAEVHEEADARLIAAAPDLLEALKRMASIIDKMGDMPDGFIHPSPWQTLKCEEALTQARAAIKVVEEGK